jgi:glycosyltransferase involved in cell wall biosynthesis
VGHMLTQVDHVIVADNRSTDGTRDILAEMPITVVYDPEPGYYQSAKMTRLAVKAAEMGAKWVIPFDADEWWYSPHGRIADVLGHIKERATVAVAELYDHVATGMDSDLADPVKRIGWRRPYLLPLVKVAFRYQHGVVVDQGNHNATYPDPDDHRVVLNRLMIRHFPYRSVEQFLRKVHNGADAYRATSGLAPDAGAHGRQWGDLLERDGEDAIAAIFHTWYYREVPDQEMLIGGEMQPALVCDPAP